MAELVDDDVVAQARGQEEQLVAEIKIGFAGTAAPTPLLIPDRHAIPGETVVLIKVVEPFGNHGPRRLFMLQVRLRWLAPARALLPHDPKEERLSAAVAFTGHDVGSSQYSKPPCPEGRGGSAALSEFTAPVYRRQPSYTDYASSTASSSRSFAVRASSRASRAASYASAKSLSPSSS